MGSALAEPTTVSAATARSAANSDLNVALSLKIDLITDTFVRAGPTRKGRSSYSFERSDLTF
jgi:hypothetical protein